MKIIPSMKRLLTVAFTAVAAVSTLDAQSYAETTFEAVAAEVEAIQVEPTPTPEPVAAPQNKERYSNEKTRQGMIEAYAKYGFKLDPKAFGKEEVLSEEESARLYGRRVEYFEPDPADVIPGCMYTPGFANPDRCFNDQSKLIYNAEVDDISILEKLKAEHRLRMLPSKLMNEMSSKPEGQQPITDRD